jgi:hypothetical protein
VQSNIDMIIALDTEFTAFHNPRLISIGLVAATGEEFYAELAVPPHECSDFVRETVLPLLGQDPQTVCQDDYELRTRLLTWLRIIRGREPMQIVFDYTTDWDLFATAVGAPVPDFCIPRPLRDVEQNELLLYDFWRRNPDLHEHHALHDARGLLYSIQLR